MAVTETSDGKSKPPVEGRVEVSARGGADAGACQVNKQSDSDGSAAGHRNINKDIFRMVKLCKLRRCTNKVNESDSLSGIDDAEVSGYLNTNEEVNYKRVLWEAMNRNYTQTQAKKRKRKTQAEKAVSVKKSAKTTEKVQGRRPSSRINYDALKLLDDELKQGSERGHIIKADSYGDGNENSPYENISKKRHGSNAHSYDEDEHDISYCEDNQTFDHHDGEMCYGDEHFDGEYFDF